jgi:sugar-specific transcriptional regulator TrmB
MIVLEKYLEEIGLSEKEAKVYLSLLQFDSANIQQITGNSKINRTTVYPVLESLTKKGLVNESIENKKTAYQAVAPEHLETFIEQQKLNLQEKLSRLKDIIPQIKSVAREKGERPIIKFFEGHDGAIAAYEEFYRMYDKDSKNGYFIFDRDLLAETFTEKEHVRFRAIRSNKQVTPVSVYTSNQVGDIFKTDGMRKKIDSKKFPITSDISIIEDRIIITTLGEKISSFVIKSKDIANTLKSLVQYIVEQK